jgi:5'-phosphate synthase pdxT subunit
MKVGVLALQGDVREHVSSLIACGVDPISVRRIEELHSVDALVIPGGESTTIAQLAEHYQLLQPIRTRIVDGMPVYGSCAGMILLADRVLDAIVGQKTFGGLDITVRRNAFGRQVDSFESDINFNDGGKEKVHAVFIRAPWVEEIGKDISVLASVLAPDGKSHPVAVRGGNLLATSFHPELMGDHRIHRYFIEEIARPALVRGEHR